LIAPDIPYPSRAQKNREFHYFIPVPESPRELSNILGCEVDLATPDSLHKELRDDILKEAVHAA